MNVNGPSAPTRASRRSGHSAIVACTVSKGDLCSCFHKGSLQAVQVVATLSASRLPKQPTGYSPGG